MVVLARANGNPDITCKITLSLIDVLLTMFIGALADLGVWTVVETNIGILLACLPSMLPSLRLLLGRKTRSMGDEGRDSDLSGSGNSNWKSRKNSLNFSRLNDAKGTEMHNVPSGPSVSVYRTTSESKDEFPDVAPLYGIHVKRDIEWSQHDSRRGQN